MNAVDDREYPDDNSNVSRLMRWLVDHKTDPRIRSEGADRVTMTGDELFTLLLEVTDWAYWDGADDVKASPQRLASFALNSLAFEPPGRPTRPPASPGTAPGTSLPPGRP